MLALHLFILEDRSCPLLTSVSFNVNNNNTSLPYLYSIEVYQLMDINLKPESSLKFSCAQLTKCLWSSLVKKD